MTEEYRGARLEHLDPRADGAHGTAPKFTEIISRHVQQAANFNKLLEKEQLWKERGKELARKHQDTGELIVQRVTPAHSCTKKHEWAGRVVTFMYCILLHFSVTPSVFAGELHLAS